jgi:hypothetical protein
LPGESFIRRATSRGFVLDGIQNFSSQLNLTSLQGSGMNQKKFFQQALNRLPDNGQIIPTQGGVAILC